MASRKGCSREKESSGKFTLKKNSYKILLSKIEQNYRLHFEIIISLHIHKITTEIKLSYKSHFCKWKDDKTLGQQY